MDRFGTEINDGEIRDVLVHDQILEPILELLTASEEWKALARLPQNLLWSHCCLVRSRLSRSIR